MQVTAAWRKGRVDAVVQSTDKNFMVPVGGAVIAAPKHNTALVEAVNKVGPRVVCLHSVFHQNVATLDCRQTVPACRGVQCQRHPGSHGIAYLSLASHVFKVNHWSPVVELLLLALCLSHISEVIVILSIMQHMS